MVRGKGLANTGFCIRVELAPPESVAKRVTLFSFRKCLMFVGLKEATVAAPNDPEWLGMESSVADSSYWFCCINILN